MRFKRNVANTLAGFAQSLYLGHVEQPDIDISPIHRMIIDSQYKGFPIKFHGKSIAEFLGTKPNLFKDDFLFPVMVLKESAIKNNIRRMAEFCKENDFDLAPHVKTPMSPQLAKLQIEAGAWAITVANFNQAMIFLNYGFNRIIIGNEVLEQTAISEIARLNYLKKAEIFFYVDSISALKIVKDAISNQKDAKLNILIEIGAPGGRAGIRDLNLLPELLTDLLNEKKIEIRGVTGFEGAVPDGDREKGQLKIRKFLAEIVTAAKIVQPYVQNRLIISAGGSSFFDYVVEEFKKFDGDAHFILRSGGYISHDHIHYEELYPFMGRKESEQFLPALELWSRVLSTPERELAILNFGKRDAGNDLDNPTPIKKFNKRIEQFDAKIDKLNDQHAFMDVELGKVVVGELICCGISHPCTNFDKWRLIPMVDDNYDIVDCVHTFF